MTRTNPKRILILTIAGDYHAYAVAEALKHKGAEVELWHTSDFPSQGIESILFEGDEMSIEIRDPDLRLVDPEVTTVWNRRSLMTVDKDVLHPADSAFAELECYVFRTAFCDILSQSSFWVNPWRAAVRTEHKPVQRHFALQVGLESPDTLFSNDPEGIRRFIDKYDGQVVYKPLIAQPWTDGDKVWMPYTSVVAKDALPADEVLQNTPGIYQQIIAKDHELRVTVMGRHVFAAKLRSQETSRGQLDWRRSQKEIAMEPHELDAGIADKCLALMERLGLVFGCFDFIVTPEGRRVFLEVNQMGQFLFLDLSAGLPLLDAFSEFLIQGRVDFEWSADQAEIFYTLEMEKEVIAIADGLKERHLAVPPPIWNE